MMSHKKLGMWLFVASDAMTFGALIAAYLYIGAASAGQSVSLGSLMTLILLASSLTMFYAVRAAKSGDRSRALRYLICTMLGGLCFLILHLNEWRVAKSPPFFTLTGLHMIHVAAGVLYLAFIARRGTAEDIDAAGVYWYFVDVVWLFLFPLLYLMPAPVALAQCTMCRTAAASAQSAALDLGILILFLPAVMLFGAIVVLTIRYRA